MSASHRRAALAAVAALALALGCTLALLRSAPSGATTNPDNYDCRGHIAKGDPAPGDDSPQVKYIFGCSGPITGYQVQADQAIGSFDTAPIAIDGGGTPVSSDGFTCNGDIPGLAVNCVGTYAGALVDNQYETVVGQFSIADPVCREPRVDPLLTVVYATADKTGKVTQHIAGPYDLGRPRGCKPSVGHRRIPKGGLTFEPAKPKAAKKKHAKR